eukprot:1885604-Ditylum_brightwellii.AAC.1
MQKIVKCKPVDMVEGKFDLVEVILKGDALMHWLEFKQVEIAQRSKNSIGTDTPPLRMCNPTFTICLQEPKKHCFPKNLAHLQKADLCNHTKKLNKLSIKNATDQICNVNEDELCDILYCMVKHDWRDTLRKSGRNSTNMNLQDLMDYFEQIKLLEVVKQKSETIILDDDTDK